MKNKLLTIIAASAFALSAVDANAVAVNVIPSTNQIAVGSSLQVRVEISDLSNTSVGAYDFDLLFNSFVLSYSSAVWGDPVLGDQLDLAQLGSLSALDVSAAANGKINAYEISFDDVATLNNFQTDHFTLLTFNFDVINNGISPLTASVYSLGSSEGDPLFADVTNSSVSTVPLPATLPLLASALLLTFGKARYRKSA